MAECHRVHKESIWYSEKIMAIGYLRQNSVVILPIPNCCVTFTHIYLSLLKFNLFSEAAPAENSLVMFHGLLS